MHSHAKSPEVAGAASGLFIFVRELRCHCRKRRKKERFWKAKRVTFPDFTPLLGGFNGLFGPQSFDVPKKNPSISRIKTNQSQPNTCFPGGGRIFLKTGVKDEISVAYLVGL